MTAVVWSKTHCPYCDQAKNLLKLKGIDYEERNITEGTWTKDQLMAAVPAARTVPQIFLDGEYVGGYHELRTKLNG
jgi:glutaredoxin 3